MTVRQRKWKNKDGTSSSCWMVDITYDHPNGRVERIRKTAPGTTKREAEAYERQIISALIQGTYGTHKEVPLYKDFYEDWMRDHCKVHMRPSSQRIRGQISKAYLVPTYGHLRLDEITTKIVAEHTSELFDNGRRKPRTVNTIIETLAAQLSVAVQWGLIDHRPKMARLRVPKTERVFLDFDEADRLIEAAKPEPEAHALILLALRAGLRIGELLALRWQDLDLIKQVLTVNRSLAGKVVGATKNGKSRDIPLSDDVVEVLQAQRLRTALLGEYVFSIGRDKSSAYGTVSRLLRRLCRAAGVREVTWHSLRHSFASHLIMLNVPVKAVQELLGHSNIEVTMIYAHLLPGTTATAVGLLDSREVFGTIEAQKNQAKIIDLATHSKAK